MMFIVKMHNRFHNHIFKDWLYWSVILVRAFWGFVWCILKVHWVVGGGVVFFFVRLFCTCNRFANLLIWSMKTSSMMLGKNPASHPSHFSWSHLTSSKWCTSGGEYIIDGWDGKKWSQFWYTYSLQQFLSLPSLIDLQSIFPDLFIKQFRYLTWRYSHTYISCI